MYMLGTAALDRCGETRHIERAGDGTKVRPVRRREMRGGNMCSRSLMGGVGKP